MNLNNDIMNHICLVNGRLIPQANTHIHKAEIFDNSHCPIVTPHDVCYCLRVKFSNEL